MYKQKQIDISKVKSPEIRKRLEICEMENYINSGFDIAYKIQTSNFPNCIAETLYDAGYRKIPEGSVMLTREEYDDLLVVAEVMKKNPAIMDSLKYGYIAGFKDGYNAAVKDFDEAILEYVRGPKIFTQAFQEFITPKVQLDPPIKPCESKEEMYARIHLEKAIRPGEIVAIKGNEGKKDGT